MVVNRDDFSRPVTHSSLADTEREWGIDIVEKLSGRTVNDPRVEWVVVQEADFHRSHSGCGLGTNALGSVRWLFLCEKTGR